jgi:hypothetical protein
VSFIYARYRQTYSRLYLGTVKIQQRLFSTKEYRLLRRVRPKRNSKRGNSCKLCLLVSVAISWFSSALCVAENMADNGDDEGKVKQDGEQLNIKVRSNALPVFAFASFVMM